MVFPGTAFAHESGIHLHTDCPSTNIAFAETIMDKDVFAPGAQFYSKPLDEAQQEEEELTAKKGDKVIAFDDEAPVDTILGVEIFPVIHMKTQEKIYVSLEDIKDG